jgi:hypothetical protein
MTEALFEVTKDQPHKTHLSSLTINSPRLGTVFFQSLILAPLTIAVPLDSPLDQMSAEPTTLKPQ